MGVGNPPTNPQVIRGRIFYKGNSMRKSRYTNSQILAILKQAQAGTPVPELCREHGMSSATFYKWRAKYSSMDSPMVARLKELEAENARLKKMYAEERIKAEILKEAIEKKWLRHLAASRWRKKHSCTIKSAYDLHNGITSVSTASTANWSSIYVSSLVVVSCESTRTIGYRYTTTNGLI